MSTKIRILYIDDYELDRELVRDSLEKEHGGFELMEASNKQEFETMLRTHEFDLILSDFNIAGFEGLQVLEAVKAHDPRLPVIIVTGTGSEEIAAMALKQGASDYVIKRSKHIQRLPQTILSTIEKQKFRYQRQQAEMALKESEEKFRNISESSLVGIYIIQDGIFTYINPKFAEIFGYSVEECLDNMHFRQLVYPEDIDIVEEQVKKRSSGESEFVRYAFRGIKKDGKIIHVEIFGSSVILDGKRAVTGTMLDITERKQSEAALRKSEEKYRELVESANSIILRMDKDGNITFFNRYAQQFFGYAEQEILGKNALDTIMPETESTGRVLKKMLLDIKRNPQKYFQNENENIKKNSERVWISWTNKPIMDENGNVVEILSIGNDITDKKTIEKQLRQAQKMESIGNLAGGIAHDFNNILSSIIGFTELALDDVKKGTALEDSLQEVYIAGKRAKDLVKQILAFARQSDEKRSPIQPGMIAKEVLKFIRSTIPTTIDIQQDIRSNSLILGSATQVHQVLMNLCTNAAHAMEDTGGILDVSVKDAFFDRKNSPIGMRPGNYVEIKVSDTGAGISPKIIGSIFEPYFTTKDPGEGTGMGLAMAQGVIESYGGKITVDSLLGKGTTFTISIPATKKRSGHVACEPEEEPSGTERILLVDDEAPIAKMGGQILERLGYSVTTRTSSIEALELFQAKPNDFDLVVTDMTMPNLTGDKLAIELMKIRSEIPVILCTGYSSKISDATAAEMGIKAFAYKPVVKSDLAKTVRNVLDAARSKAVIPPDIGGDEAKRSRY